MAEAMAGRRRSYHPRAMIRALLRIDDTPHSIAFGSALGMAIAMTPTIGIQIVVAVVLCTALRANRVAGVAMVFISNPLTMVPIYWADYWLGAKLLGSAMISKEDFAAIWGRIIDAGMLGGIREAFVVLTGEIFFPMMLGGTLIGIALAVPLYPITYRAVEARRRRRELRRAYQRLREERARGGADPIVRADPGAAPPAVPEPSEVAAATPASTPVPMPAPVCTPDPGSDPGSDPIPVREDARRSALPEERLAEPEREESFR